MSETDQDEAKRRRRARFVDVLTASARQPGERSRLGTRVAGATAVLALAAGATLGLGAWRSYQADQDTKQLKLAAEQSTARAKLTQSPSPSAAPTRGKPSATPKKPPRSAVPAAPVVRPTAHPSTSPGKKNTQPKLGKTGTKPTPKIAVYPAESVLLNASTGQCADIPDFGPGKVNTAVNQHKCDATDADNQLWDMKIEPVGKGPGGTDLVLFSNAKDGLCLDVPMFKAQPAGTALIEANCDGTMGDNQLWWLDPIGDGTVQVRNYVSGQLCMRPGGIAAGGHDRRLMIDSCGTNSDSHWLLWG